MKCFICWKLCRRCLPSELPARLHTEAVPPSINMSATHEIYLIHDGILSGRSGAGKVDPEMVAPYVAQAARDMKLGVFDCRVIATEDDAQTMVGVSAIALKIHADADRRGTKRKTHLLLFWSFRECAVCDQGWNRIESVVSTEEMVAILMRH